MLDYQIKLLEAKIRGVEVSELFGNTKLSQEQQELLEKYIEKLKSGYPLDYLLGEVHILELRLKLNENVLIPRPETEEWLLDLGRHPQLDWVYPTTKSKSENITINGHRHSEQVRSGGWTCSVTAFDTTSEESPTIENNGSTKTNQNLLVDLGCGSGIIGLYLANFFEQIFAVDISPKALEIAKENATVNGINNIKFFLSDGLSDELLKNKITYFCNNYTDWTLVANLPYVPISDKINEAEHKTQYEPDLAIYSGNDGLDLFRKVLVELESFETKPAQIIFELDPRNIRIASELLEKINYATNIWIDSGGFERVLIGNKITHL